MHAYIHTYIHACIHLRICLDMCATNIHAYIRLHCRLAPFYAELSQLRAQAQQEEVGDQPGVGLDQRQVDGRDGVLRSRVPYWTKCYIMDPKEGKPTWY